MRTERHAELDWHRQCRHADSVALRKRVLKARARNSGHTERMRNGDLLLISTFMVCALVYASAALGAI